MLQECNLIIVQNRIQLVCNGNGGLMLEVCADDLLHELVCFRVHAGICQT